MFLVCDLGQAEGKPRMEGYAAGRPAASADAGRRVLVGELTGLVSELTGPAAGQMSFGEIEQQVIVRGRELLRMVTQQVMDERAAGEQRRAQVTGTDGIPRTRAERGHARTVVTWFGPVTVRRLAYRAPGAANLYLADAVLNLPVRRYSWAVQRAAVRYALAGSYEQAQLWLQDLTGVSIGKQQLEQILAEAARDAPGFCPSRPAVTCPAGLPLAISADGKGVAMRPGARRAETARKARHRAPQAFGNRLGTGQKAGQKRIAETGAVFDVQPPAWCFCPPRGPAAEDWVTARGLDILHGRVAEVISPIRALTAADPPRPGSEHDKIIARTLSYLQAKEPYLDYPRALAAGWPIATGVIEGYL